MSGPTCTHGSCEATAYQIIIRRLRRLLDECAPHVYSQADAEHMLDGFGPKTERPTDDLTARLRAELAQ